MKENEIIVFGSNLEGLFNDGPSRVAYEYLVANRGQGVGLQGQSYAIPIMRGSSAINESYVDKFISFALNHPEYKFIVTRLDSKITGVSPDDIALLFLKVIDVPNVILPKKYVQVILSLSDVVIGGWHAWDSKRDFLDEYHSLTERMVRGEYDAYDKLKRLRRSVYRHTVAVANHGWYMTEHKKRYVFPEDSNMVNNTVRYSEMSEQCWIRTPIRGLHQVGVPQVPQDMPQNAAPTIVEVENIDCLDAGAKLKEQGYNPAVLNMFLEHIYNESENGGDGTNEETMLRTNLFRSLFDSIEEVDMRIFYRDYFINRYIIYTPNAIYFRKSEQKGYALLDEPVSLSFITVAVECNHNIVYFPNNQAIPDDLVEPFRNKIRSIFRIGLVHGHDSLVLGALGCGAFHNPPHHVARLFHEVMDEPEFKNKYRRIVFAILDNHHAHQNHNPAGNYKPFFNEFTRIDVDSDFQKWIEVNEIHSRTLECYNDLMIKYKERFRKQHELTPKLSEAYYNIMRSEECLEDYYGGYYIRITQCLDLLDKKGETRGEYHVQYNHHGEILDDW